MSDLDDLLAARDSFYPWGQKAWVEAVCVAIEQLRAERDAWKTVAGERGDMLMTCDPVLVEAAKADRRALEEAEALLRELREQGE